MSAIVAGFVFVTQALLAPLESPREVVFRNLTSQMLHIRATATAAATRRRVGQPSPCAQAVLAQRVLANWLVLSNDLLYFADEFDGIMRVPKSGGMPARITPTIGLANIQIVIDDSTIYFITKDDATTGSLYSVSRSGGTPRALATKLPAPIDMAVDSTSVYWVNLGTIMGEDVAADGSVERILKNGTGRQVLAANLSAPATIAIDESDLYFGETGVAIANNSAGLRRMSKSGGAVTKLIDGPPVVAMTTREPLHNLTPDAGSCDLTLVASLLGC